MISNLSVCVSWFGGALYFLQRENAFEGYDCKWFCKRHGNFLEWHVQNIVNLWKKGSFLAFQLAQHMKMCSDFSATCAIFSQLKGAFWKHKELLHWSPIHGSLRKIWALTPCKIFNQKPSFSLIFFQIKWSHVTKNSEHDHGRKLHWFIRLDSWSH